MDAIIIEAKAHEQALHAEGLLERGDDGDRAAHTDERRGPAPLLLQPLRGAHDVLRLGIESDGLRAATTDELDAAIRGQTLSDEAADAVEHFLRILAGHEPAGDLHRSLCGDDRLGTCTLVAPSDAIEFEGGARPDLLEHAVARLAGGMRQAHLREECLVIETQPTPLRELLCRGLLETVVKAGDAHLAVAIVHLAHDTREHANRIGGGSTVAARMQIAA